MTGNLYLIGLPGVGKTTLGQALADPMGRAFVDLDQRIVERIGQPIADYFASHGEAAFRRIETEVLEEAARASDQVVATGGGIVLLPENRETLRRSGLVLWLRRDPRAILGDLRDDSRPLLMGDAAARLQALSAQRTPLYAGCAHHIVDNDAPPEETIQRILALLEGI